MNVHRRNKSDALTGVSTKGLPNIRIKKFNKQPLVYRSLNNQEASILLQNKLSELASLTEVRETDSPPDILNYNVKQLDKTKTDFQPGITSRDFLKFDADIKDELLRITNNINFNHRRTKSSNQYSRKAIRPITPMLDFEQTNMPIDLAIMAQVRRGLMNQIKKKTVGNLTIEKLDEIKRNLIPDSLKNIENSSNLYVEQLMQKQKEKSEMLSRHPLGNASYNIFALGKKSRSNIRKTLYSTMPDGSRFIQRKLFG